MTYFQHLKANWKVAAHSLNDALEHFLHGLVPVIYWEHQQSTEGINEEKKNTNQ